MQHEMIPEGNNNMDSIRSKIIVNVLILLFTIISIIGIEYDDLLHLAEIQGIGVKRSADAVTAEIGTRVGLSLHSVITGAVINRDLGAVAKEWVTTRELSLKRLVDVARAADTREEKEWIEAATNAAREIITIFETRTVPLLKTTDGISKEIRDLDAAIDTQVKIVRVMMLKINESIDREAKSADEDFDRAIRQAMIKALIVGLIGILLQAGLATWLMQTIFKKDAERKQAGELLRNREEIFSLFMKHSPFYTYIKQVTSTENRVLQASDNFQQMIGLRGSEMIGKTMQELFPADIAAKIIADDWSVVARGETQEFEEDFNGRNYFTTKFPVVQCDNTYLAGYTIDTTERKRADAALLESELRFRSLMEDIPSIAAQGYAIDGTVIFWNRASELLYGFSSEEALGANLLDLIIPAEMREGVAGAMQQMIESDEAIPAGELLLQRKDGSRVPVFSSHALLKPMGRQPELFCLDIDLTERKSAEEQRINLEKQLLHAQKLESLGVLAGGIAHDFNNILMAIMGNADLALMRINKESPAVENLHRIEQAAARAADLAKQMLAYSGKGKFVVEQINLNILLEEMLHMLEVSISKKAVLRLNPYQHLPTTEADATQMRQIIMNLVINASEAIGEKNGVIDISTGCIDCDRNNLKDVWLDENISEGLYVYLEISDSGCGMDKETMAKLFDPFFTTKFTGRGLGMAAVLGIVRGHKGAIKIYSEPNRGTTFKIMLPASSRPAEIFTGTSHHDGWKGEGKALLVDDEETVRGIGTEMLRELGFTVITADDGCEGVEKFKQNPDICFVILDLTMPHMDGEQCFRELRQLKPDAKVIMCSGYNEQEVTQKFVGKGLAGFIQKPYKLSILEETIRRII